MPFFGAIMRSGFIEKSFPQNFPDLPKDALQSVQFQTLIELLGSGEIEGFPSATGSKGSTEYNISALKDVFLNNTQVLQQAAGTSPNDEDFNFLNITFEPRFGTANQTAIAGITETESETSVGVTVTQSTPVSRSISNTNVDAVRVTLGFPTLQKFEDNGDINGAEVALTIQTIENDGTTTTVITDTVKGRTASTYFRDYKINLPSGTSFPVTIRVNRTTADSTETTLQNSFQWSSFTEIINESRAYANFAHVALRFDAATFPNQPQRMYRIRGTKIKIPHNGTVRADGSISYSGTFNGTFKTDKEYSNDPAWILYDLLTTSKGFGDHIAESSLDVFSFFSASQYASEQVDDGTGTGNTEARFSANVVLNSQRAAYDTINNLAAVMRAMPFYSAGAVNISCDKPTDASYIYNLSNVSEAGFSYSSASKDTKYTVVNVSYFDMETAEIDYETTEDTALQTKYGIVTKNLNGFACTSRGQAARLGRWFLYTQNNEAETVTFTASLESGTIVRVGTVINIADPMRAGVRRGGRIKTGVSTTQIIVDDQNNTDLATTGSATLSVILSDGSLETKTISSVSGATITVSSAFSSVPQTNSVWVIENTSVQLQTFRVVSVTEQELLNYQIVAIVHNPDKYSFVENGTALPTRTITTLTALKDAPSNLQASEKIVVLNNRAVSKLFIQWQPVSGVTEYLVQYRFQDENFISERVTRSDFTIFETLKGVYEIRIFSFNALGKPSHTPNTVSITTVGKTAPPAAITGLTYEPLTDKLARLRWDLPTSVDVLHGGRIFVRHTPDSTGNGTFSNATDLIQALAGNTTSAEVPILEGEIILKTQDDTGNFSTGETSVIIDLPNAQPKLITQTRREDQDSPKFQGTKTNIGFDPVSNSINLSGTGQFDDITDFDAEASLDDLGGVSPTGTYDFGGTAGGTTLDLGGVFALDLKKHVKSQAIYPNDLIDSRGLIDDLQDFDGTASVDVNADMLVRVTTDDPSSGSPTYTDFQKFANGTYRGRGFQFRANLTSNDPAQDIQVTELGYTASLQRRTEQNATAIASGAGAKSVTFDHPFFVGTSSLLGANSHLPSVGITATDLASGDFFTLTNVSSTGFTVHFKNSSGSSINRNFNFTAVGFGKGG